MALYTSIAKGDLSLWTSSEFYLQEKFCRSDADRADITRIPLRDTEPLIACAQEISASVYQP